MVEPFRDRSGSPLRTESLPGRMHFLRPGKTAVGPGGGPPFGCMLLTWTPPLQYRPDAISGGLFAPINEENR